MNPEILKYPIGSIDTHLHSRISSDSEMGLQAACRQALKMGLKALAFTEHADFDPSDPGCNHYDDRKYNEDLAEARVAMGRSLKIYKGIEITYQPQRRQQILDFIHQHQFDFTLGSIHIVGPKDISRPEIAQKHYGTIEEEQAYGEYFREVEKLIDSRLFDCLGHLDLCKRYGHLQYGPLAYKKYEKYYKKLVKRLIQSDLMLEINTSGLRQPVGETFPPYPAVLEYLRMGGTKLTLGSDAHQAQDVGAGFSRVLNDIPQLNKMKRQ
jgi:histidinol-phosphatase (PHP family)